MTRRPARGGRALARLVPALALLAAAVVHPSAAPGQQVGTDGVRAAVSRVEGVVRARSADGGAPLPFAMVDVEGRGAVLADAEGRYALRGVPPGLVRVVASHVGYGAAEVEVLVPATGTVTLDLELAREALELPGIVVSAPPLTVADPDERALPAGAIRTMVGLRALEASPGIAESGLGRGGERSPGGGEPGEALLLRGSSADLKLVLLDGAPVYAPFHLGGLLPSFDAATLGAARHHVGGAPARYDGGLSYILDLRTRSPRRDRLRGRASVDLVSVGGSLETPLGGNAGLLVAGRRLHGFGGTLAGGDGSPYGFADALVRLEADAGTGGRLTLTGFANEEAVFLDLDAGDAPPATSLGQARDAAWGNRALAARWDGSLGGTRLEIGASTSRYDAELPVHQTVGDSAAGPTTWTVLATGRTSRNRLTVDAVREGGVRFGVALDRMRLTYGFRGDAATGTESSHEGRGTVVGGYVEGTRSLTDGLDVRWGARLDRFGVDAAGDEGSSLQGALRLALLWDLGGDALLTLAAGRYHQLARRGDADVDLAVGESVQVGTGAVPDNVYHAGPLLSVARADHVVASLDQRVGENVQLDTELFFKTFRNVAGVGSRTLTSSGIDLRVLRQGERASAWLGYSLAWFWEATGTGGSTGFSGRHLLNVGFESALVGPTGIDLRLAFSDGLPLTAVPFSDRAVADGAEEDFTTETPRVDLESGAVDGFLRIDAEVFADLDGSAAGLGGRLRPYLKVLNALDRRDALFYYFEPWRSDELRPLAELSLVPVLGLEWRF